MRRVSRSANQIGARSSKALYSNDCVPKCAAAPIDSMTAAQSISIPKLIPALNGSSLVLSERCAVWIDRGKPIVVGIFNLLWNKKPDLYGPEKNDFSTMWNNLAKAHAGASSGSPMPSNSKPWNAPRTARRLAHRRCRKARPECRARVQGRKRIHKFDQLDHLSLGTRRKEFGSQKLIAVLKWPTIRLCLQAVHLSN